MSQIGEFIQIVRVIAPQCESDPAQRDLPQVVYGAVCSFRGIDVARSARQPPATRTREPAAAPALGNQSGQR